MMEIRVSGRVLLDDDGDWTGVTVDEILGWLQEVTVGAMLASDIRSDRQLRSLRVTSLDLAPR